MKKTIRLGSYNSKPIYWSFVGNIDGHDLYLCDKILTNVEYGRKYWHSDGYMTSLPRHVCLYIYNSFSDEEKSRLYNHKEIDDPVFLLSDEEYDEFRSSIIKVNEFYWLRTPGDYPYAASYVVPAHKTTDGEDGAGYYGGGEEYYGIRPAILLKSEN